MTTLAGNVGMHGFAKRHFYGVDLTALVLVSYLHLLHLCIKSLQFVVVIIRGWVAGDAHLAHCQLLDHFMSAHLLLQVTIIPGTGTMVCRI